jgi:hypothetical protein
LEFLINQHQPAIGAILTNGMVLSRMLQHLIDVIPFSFPAASKNIEELTMLITGIKGVRDKRNLFIHGNWLLSSTDLLNDEITRIDLRLKSKNKGYTLTRMNSKKFPKNDLVALDKQIGELAYRTCSFGKKLGSPTVNVET